MYKPLYLEMGGRIRAKRKLLGLTSEQFAEQMGISNQFLCDVELGKKALSYANLVKLCALLCVSADYVLLGRESGAEDDAPAYRSSLELLRGLEPALYPAAEAALANLVQIAAIVRREVRCGSPAAQPPTT